MRDVRNAAGQRRETPYGVLYSPKTFGLQVLVLVGAFAGGPVIGWLTARTGGVSSTGEVILYVPPTLIFFFGGQQSRFERITTPDETVGIPIEFKSLQSVDGRPTVEF